MASSSSLARRFLRPTLYGTLSATATFLKKLLLPSILIFGIYIYVGRIPNARDYATRKDEIQKEEELFRILTKVDRAATSCTCKDENFCFREEGQPFDCKLHDTLAEMNLTKDARYEREATVKPEEVVFVIYSNTAHFYKARKALTMLRSLGNNLVIFYDLGLASSELDELKNVCNLEVRRFPFEKHPAHVAKLYTYAFKPILVAEVHREYPAFWFFDTSVRPTSIANMSRIYSLTDTGNDQQHQPIVLAINTGHSIGWATSRQMFRHLPLLGAKWNDTMWGATVGFVRRSDKTREILKWWLLCALTETCIAPDDAKLACSLALRKHPYGKCHRFDQSALNIIMSDYPATTDPTLNWSFDDMMTIERMSGDVRPIKKGGALSKC